MSTRFGRFGSFCGKWIFCRFALLAAIEEGEGEETPGILLRLGDAIAKAYALRVPVRVSIRLRSPSV